MEEELDEFNKGPTAGTLNDKKRMAFIYEELLNVRDMLISFQCPNCGHGVSQTKENITQ